MFSTPSCNTYAAFVFSSHRKFSASEWRLVIDRFYALGKGFEPMCEHQCPYSLCVARTYDASIFTT
eukprot:scaffold10199_cov146-Cylindrotheca_fusiformis.AAC.4